MWRARDKDGSWWEYEIEPSLALDMWDSIGDSYSDSIKPPENVPKGEPWDESLYKVISIEERLERIEVLLLKLTEPL